MKTCVIAATVLVVASVTEAAWVLAESPFDAGEDGWTLLGGPYTTWQGTGGNPGGFIRFERARSMEAPAAFLGNWTSWGVTSLTHDVKVFAADPAMFYVVIDGPGGRALWWDPWLSAGGDWTALTVPMEASLWEVQSGSWNALLNNVTELSVSLYWSGSQLPEGVFDAGIDNVRLWAGEVIPVPGALLLGGIGAGLTGWLRRRRVL